MYFHDNPTDTQHYRAHTYEVGLGSTAPLRNPSGTARTTFGYQAEFTSLCICTSGFESDEKCDVR